MENMKYLVIVYDDNSKKYFNSFFENTLEMSKFVNETQCKIMNIYKLDELDKENFK